MWLSCSFCVTAFPAGAFPALENQPRLQGSPGLLSPPCTPGRGIWHSPEENQSKGVNFGRCDTLMLWVWKLSVFLSSDSNFFSAEDLIPFKPN